MHCPVPITRWRHKTHEQKVVLNKLFLLHDFLFVISTSLCGEHTLYYNVDSLVDVQSTADYVASLLVTLSAVTTATYQLIQNSFITI